MEFASVVQWRSIEGLDPGEVVEYARAGNGRVFLRDRHGKIVAYTISEFVKLADAIRDGELDDLEVTDEQNKAWRQAIAAVGRLSPPRRTPRTPAGG